MRTGVGGSCRRRVLPGLPPYLGSCRRRIPRTSPRRAWHRGLQGDTRDDCGRPRWPAGATFLKQPWQRRRDGLARQRRLAYVGDRPGGPLEPGPLGAGSGAAIGVKLGSDCAGKAKLSTPNVQLSTLKAAKTASLIPVCPAPAGGSAGARDAKPVSGWFAVSQIRRKPRQSRCGPPTPTHGGVASAELS